MAQFAVAARSPVIDEYRPTDNAFTGKIDWVQIDIGDAATDQDHLINPEERLRIALATQ